MYQPPQAGRGARDLCNACVWGRGGHQGEAEGDERGVRCRWRWARGAAQRVKPLGPNRIPLHDGRLPFGQTACAVTPAAVPAAMPRSGGAAKRQGDVASLTLVAEVEGTA